MKTLICVSVVCVGIIGWSQTGNAASYHSPLREYIPSETYESNRPDAVVQVVQIALQRRGYYVGLTSGEYAAETRVAVCRYQRDQGLRKSGKIDRVLLRSLGIG